jgi:hypothetical protein
MYRRINIAVIFVASFPMTITYPYENVICNVTILKKLTPMSNVNVLYFRTNVEFEWSARVMGWSKSGQAKPSEAAVVSMHLRCFGLGTNMLDIFILIMCVA